MRRAIYPAMKPQGAKCYKHTQELEASLLIKDLLDDPVDWEKHLSRVTASSILSIIYRRAPIKSAEDPDVLRVRSFISGVYISIWRLC